ncbi:MAG: hypothetical protein EOM04_03865 [Clostridia bacterium]|nr:hypothetical protein [Clostridia bacterium]
MISIVDLGYFILFALLAALVIYLIITLKNINDLLKEAKRITIENEKSLQSTLESVSGITNNIDLITKDVNGMSTLVKGGFERADRTLGVVEKNIKGSAESVKHNVEESAGAVRRNVEELASYIGLITKVVDSFASIFLNRKK